MVIHKLLSAFRRDDVRYALMGGFALGLWGVGRTTVDLDILVNRDDIARVSRIMKELGYECRFQSENVSQYISPLNVFGEVDFLHAFRTASLEMLEHAEEKEVFAGSFKVKVLKAEDIIGLKLQAIANNPARERNDLADIESLISANKNNLDWSWLEKYFKLFEMTNLYQEIYRRYH